LACSQIWLNLPLDHCHFGCNTKIAKKKKKNTLPLTHIVKFWFGFQARMSLKSTKQVLWLAWKIVAKLLSQKKYLQIFHSQVHHRAWSIKYFFNVTNRDTFTFFFWFVRLATLSYFAFDFRKPHPSLHWWHKVSKLASYFDFAWEEEWSTSIVFGHKY